MAKRPSKAKKNKGGRPSRLKKQSDGSWPEEVQLFLAELSAGATYADACHLSGLYESSIYRWLDEGRKYLDLVNKAQLVVPSPDNSARVKAEFWEDTNRARAEARSVWRGVLRRSKDWKAAAWELTRSDPKNYGSPAHEIKVSRDTPVPKANASIIDALAQTEEGRNILQQLVRYTESLSNGVGD